MERLTLTGKSVLICKVLFGVLLSCLAASAQTPLCVPNAGNPTLRSESLAESAADLTLSCSGAKIGAAAVASLSITTPVNITNHLATGNVPDVYVSVTAGGFSQPAPASIQLIGNNTLNISGINYTSPDGTLIIRIGNIRLNANSAIGAASPIITATVTAQTGLQLANTQVPLGTIAPGLLVADLQAGLYTGPSVLPSIINVPNLFAAGTNFGTTRVTEGFANAFRSNAQDPHATYGTRIIITYTNLPPTAELFVPNLVAGSSALQQTAGGDLGVAQSPGMYQSTPGGSLLLALVNNAAADGSGGAPVFTPPAGGTPAMNLTAATPVTVSNGIAFVVYEVVDSSLTIQESAQIQTFVALTAATAPGTYGLETATFAPVSTAGIATTTDPVPRFAAVNPPSDCTLLGDCNAGYFPHLKLNTNGVNLTAPAGGTRVVGFVPFVNSGSGELQWTASVAYQTGTGWLSLASTFGTGSSTVNVFADPSKLTAGVYMGTVTIDAGPQAGSQAVPVTFTVGAAVPLITSVGNSANGYVVQLVPGSFGSLYGTSLAGNNVTVTFDGVPATVIYSGNTQINVVVPSSLLGKNTSSVVVSVNGNQSAPVTVNLSTSSPAIFPSGVLNQDNTVNAPGKPAARGSVIQIFLTGLPPVADATANLAGRQNLPTMYSGVAPGVPGLQQVNLALPPDLTGTAILSVCASGGTSCTPPFSITIQ